MTGDYEVVVEKEGYIFQSKVISVLTPSIVIDADLFNATITLTIDSKAVTGAMLSAVQDGTAVDITVIDNGDGTYVIENLAGNYTISVAKQSYQFDSFDLNNNITTKTLMGTFSVNISIKAEGVIITRAVVTLVKGDITLTAVEGENGYTASGLSGEYTVKVVKDGYEFADGTVDVENLEITVLGALKVVTTDPPTDDKTNPPTDGNTPKGCKSSIDSIKSYLFLIIIICAAVIIKRKINYR